MKDAETNINGQLFTHKFLWECCDIHSQAADKANAEKTGPIYHELSAMLFAYLSYEAYINFLGEKVAPDAWENERHFFNTDPYRGIAGKLKKICEVCNIKNIGTGKRPYQTIIELCKLRNLLAHGKTDKYEVTIKHQKSKEPRLFRNNLYQAVTSEKMKRAIVDVRQFAELLHRNAALYVQDSFLGDDPFEGIIEHSSGDTTSKT
jgi:hypothetical protein